MYVSCRIAPHSGRRKKKEFLVFYAMYAWAHCGLSYPWSCRGTHGGGLTAGVSSVRLHPALCGHLMGPGLCPMLSRPARR